MPQPVVAPPDRVGTPEQKADQYWRKERDPKPSRLAEKRLTDRDRDARPGARP